jgi:hypothetical protein
MRKGLDITGGLVVAGTPKGVHSACITDLSESNTQPHSRIAAWSGEIHFTSLPRHSVGIQSPIKIKLIPKGLYSRGYRPVYSGLGPKQSNTVE